MKKDVGIRVSQPYNDRLGASEAGLERLEQPSTGGGSSAESARSSRGEDAARATEAQPAHGRDELSRRDETIAELRRRIGELEQHLETFATLLQAGRSRFREGDQARDPEQLLSELAERLANFEKVRQQQQRTIDQLSHSWAMRQVDDTFEQAQSRPTVVHRIADSVRRAQGLREPLFCVMIGIDQSQELRAEDGAANFGFFLVQVAHRLKLTLRESDRMMRCDDETFVLIPEASALDQVRSLAERLIRTISREPLSMGSQQLKPSISISIVQYDPEIGGANELITLARQMLAEAQTHGPKQIVVHPESTKHPDP